MLRGMRSCLIPNCASADLTVILCGKRPAGPRGSFRCDPLVTQVGLRGQGSGVWWWGQAALRVW